MPGQLTSARVRIVAPSLLTELTAAGTICIFWPMALATKFFRTASLPTQGFDGGHPGPAT